MRTSLVVGQVGALLVLAASVAFPGSASAATPSPQPTACQTPAGVAISASPSQAESGQAVTLTVSYSGCGGPARHFTVTARPLGQNAPITTVGHVVSSGQPTGTATLTVRPEHSTTYMVGEDGVVYSQLPSADVTVDRVGGGCAGVVMLTAPTVPTVGSIVPVTGSTSDTGTVTISFRKRGQSAFQVRRTLTPSPSGTFAASFVADDDYRLYASSSRCDSPPILVQAQPTINGLATARPGSTVTLTVWAAAGVPVRLYFHRAGTVGYALRRTGSTGSTGRYTATYRADADYRYYAATGPDGRTSNTGLTQAR